ncbi:hypothetical protein EMCRGX_G001239 [Ephydatia muelleri]
MYLLQMIYWTPSWLHDCRCVQLQRIWSAGQRQSILLSRLFNNSMHQGMQQQEAVAIATPRQLFPEPQRPKGVT